MAKLTLRQRAKLPARTFATGKKPGGRGGWPMPDKSHARFALTQVSRSQRKGNISAAQAAHIRSKANQKLGKA